MRKIVFILTSILMASSIGYAEDKWVYGIEKYTLEIVDVDWSKIMKPHFLDCDAEKCVIVYETLNTLYEAEFPLMNKATANPKHPPKIYKMLDISDQFEIQEVNRPKAKVWRLKKE